ncbi:hypothetical protein GPUN_0152 [Glaciecola punicea ACAM 611]|jgi:uncharacterized membrane protein|uniref:DUF502 domain-containing protein n=1 Tax=Glaciecola punicea ACAM 611 TaxID=1121923 RepID=H5T7M9_9ALTE|nr:DUF502 domain-containing protein [Glaciecola punicea]GAB54306.1 hypothetical protein GPUN_0152 [Glaciecola punicea ACAM 611]
MFNKFVLLTLKGLFTVLPFAITFYLIIWVATSTESLLSPYLPEHYYFPGLGLITIIASLAIIGLMVNAYIVTIMINAGQGLIERVPVVKTLFGATKDAVELFQIKKDTGTKKAVTVEVSEGVRLIGFITNDKVAKKLFPTEDKVAVYLPMSYQLGGYTLYVDPSKVSDLNVDVETAMRIAVTGGSSMPKSVASATEKK